MTYLTQALIFLPRKIPISTLQFVTVGHFIGVTFIPLRIELLLCHTDGGVQGRLPLLEDQEVQVRVIAA